MAGQGSAERLARWGTDWSPFGATLMGTILVALTQISSSTGQIQIISDKLTFPQEWAFYPGAILLVVGTVYQARRQNQLSNLERELARIGRSAAVANEAIENIERTELAILTGSFKHYSTERVSLFVRTASGFRLIARYSTNPALVGQRLSERGAYPSDQGCLGKAWNDGEVYRTDLPSPVEAPAEWLEAQETQFAVPRAQAETISFKCRTYAAFRINAADRGRSPLGVLVFESQLVASEANGQKLLLDDLRSSVTSHNLVRLRCMLQEYRTLLATEQ